jgi:hypothetical protein
VSTEREIVFLSIVEEEFETAKAPISSSFRSLASSSSSSSLVAFRLMTSFLSWLPGTTIHRFASSSHSFMAGLFIHPGSITHPFMAGLFIHPGSITHPFMAGLFIHPGNITHPLTAGLFIHPGSITHSFMAGLFIHHGSITHSFMAWPVHSSRKHHPFLNAWHIHSSIYLTLTSLVNDYKFVVEKFCRFFNKRKIPKILEFFLKKV